MLQRLINLGFAVAITLAAGLGFFILGTKTCTADQAKAMGALRQTAVMVNGLNCVGSGSVVRGKSGHLYLLTNSHVANCARYKGQLFATMEGGELLHGKVVAQDWAADLAAAQIDGTRASLALGKEPAMRSRVYARGYPGERLTESSGLLGGPEGWDTEFGIEQIGECPKGSKALRGLNGNIYACQLHFTSQLTSLYARPGMSGAPIVDDDGELVGVVSSMHADRNFDAGAVQYDDVKAFLDKL